MLENLVAQLGTLRHVLEIASATAIVAGFVLVTGIWLVQRYTTDPQDALARYRQALGRVILVGLELLVAATILTTVTLEPTLERVGQLAVMVAIRTILGWTTVLEVSGRWPWQGA